MAKTREELSEIRNRVNELSILLQELSEDELNEVFGGFALGDWGGQSVVGDESAEGRGAFGSESAYPYNAFLKTLLKMGDESAETRD